MNFPKKSIVNALRKAYPVGCRVVLTHMDDVQAPPMGTKGTVLGVDDAGSLLVDWDNGSSLNVVYGEDRCRKIDTVTVTCYENTKTWDSREEAKEFYLRAIAASEGSEQSRYSKIYAELCSGLNACSDEE